MNMPKGHTECYFSEDSRHTFQLSNTAAVNALVLELVAKGWKVGTHIKGDFITVYWGA